ncbi:hypothetical protein BC938DRAFT_478136, partial [Jimgerdemannia flammicorona]
MNLYQLVVLGYRAAIDYLYRREVVIGNKSCVLEGAKLRNRWIADDEEFPSCIYTIPQPRLLRQVERFRDLIARVKDVDLNPLTLFVNGCDRITVRVVKKEGIMSTTTAYCVSEKKSENATLVEIKFKKAIMDETKLLILRDI